MKNIKKIISLLLCGLMVLSLAACGGNAGQGNDDNDVTDTLVMPSENVAEGGDESLSGSTQRDDADSIRDTEKSAGQSAESAEDTKTGADTFSIEPVDAYPTTYDGLLEISREEENDPPEIAGIVENMEQYEIVFIGYPIWWGDLPTIVKVFLETYDLSGKTVIPFCTHAGSGLSGTQGTVESLCEGATVEDGLAVRGKTAQEDFDSAEDAVTDWLSGLGL